MEWMLTFAVVFLAAMIQTSTGFGFAIVAIPLFLLIHDGHYAVSLSIFLSLISSLSSLPQVRKEIDKPLLATLFYGSLAGLPIGGLIFYTVQVEWLKLFVSVAILAFTIPMMFRLRIPLGSGKGAGFLSGLMTSSIGMPGPPIVLYLTSKNTDKSRFRGTSIAYYCLVYPVSLALQFISGRVSAELLSHAVLVIPAIYIGQLAGKFIHRGMSQAWFQRITFLLLIATAINALIQSL
ncbi:sulfite exporter TauE/SafE family protein [Paenibacillus allorhizosphaerae]|uniref:Probable membrane transporter protein n=1 Tax=Paenibacillus allorhizosphaerae TaxID=2849866 RepID=A0ABM8VQM2_9BACL|nr:sulfite exporter TauE/SafE family protein [Paenibacillus allorhizosphaerae]CAG7654408.1 hypothetical protein PAECIP111802_05766 [Paenibacillus allorhizosphaerae]